MKHPFLIACISLVFCLAASSQSCLTNGITITAQSQVDNFAVDYPGCKVIEGNVNINGGNVTNLNGLSQVTDIHGSLDIIFCPGLSTLNGLNNLKSVKSISLTHTGLTSVSALLNLNSLETLLVQQGNNSLTSLHGLQSVTNLKKAHLVYTNLNSLAGLQNTKSIDDLSIYFNEMLPNLNGLQNVNAVKDLYISYNPLLTNINELQNINSLNSLAVENNNGLTNLNAFSNITALNNLTVRSNPQLSDLSGLQNIDSLGIVTISSEHLTNLSIFQKVKSIKELTLGSNPALSTLSGMPNLSYLENLSILNNDLLPNLTGLSNNINLKGLSVNGNQALTSLSGLGNITSLTGGLNVWENDQLADISTLNTLTSVGGGVFISGQPNMSDLHGLENLSNIGGDLFIENMTGLQNLNALAQLTTIGGSLFVKGNSSLTSLNGLSNLNTIGQGLEVGENPALVNLVGLEKLTNIPGNVQIYANNAMSSLNGLGNVTTIGYLWIAANQSLPHLNGLEQLTTINHSVSIQNNLALQDFNGLENLLKIGGQPLGFNDTLDGYLQIYGNPLLLSLSSLQNLSSIKTLHIESNSLLSTCAIFAICNLIYNAPNKVHISNNAQDCNSWQEVEMHCNSAPVIVNVLYLNEQGFQVPAPDVQVRLAGTVQMALRQTDAAGMVRFSYLGGGLPTLTLPQLSTSRWDISQLFTIFTAMNGNDSINATILLTPLGACPELSTYLGLPSFFRGCLTSSDLEISTQNTGTSQADGVKLAFVLPPVMELLASAPPVDAHSGDTLYFDLGDLQPFQKAKVFLTVKTDCDTFLLGQTLCMEAFSAMDNPCPKTTQAFSEIKLSAQCIAGNTVRFTLKNIGDAPTQGWHAYKVIKNSTVQFNNAFSLAAQQSISFDFPADGATWRMEATKFDDGTETAVALENCGGLTPGLITAFWLDHGPLEYDFDCRQVIGSYDPNLKSAVPTGVGDGWNNTITPNQPLRYTIDFQNTGTDTAFRVLLRDVLQESLDVNTFRPGFSSHPCTWDIRGNTLEVLFSPIALPDSNVNEAASHGFFNFEIDQMPNLPIGTNIYNNATIVFDFNPPIYTNTVYHSIGQLSVKVDEPQAYANLWQLLGNPTREQAVFQALEFIDGEKAFTLYEASGRIVRSAQFSTQEFVFQRDGLAEGVYFFRITDASHRGFSGKIMVLAE